MKHLVAGLPVGSAYIMKNVYAPILTPLKKMTSMGNEQDNYKTLLRGFWQMMFLLDEIWISNDDVSQFLVLYGGSKWMLSEKCKIS